MGDLAPGRGIWFVGVRGRSCGFGGISVESVVKTLYGYGVMAQFSALPPVISDLFGLKRQGRGDRGGQINHAFQLVLLKPR